MSDVLRHDIGSNGHVAVRVRSGDVRIRGVAGTVAHVRTRGGGDLRRVEVETQPTAIAVQSRSSDDLELEIPDTASVRLEAGSADVDVRDLHGEQEYRTASGDIRGQGLRGAVTLDAVSGDIDLVLEGLGRVHARTVSGDLALRAGRLAAFRGATTSGDLRIAAQFEGEGPFAIETVSGDVLLAPAGPLRIESSTIAGDIRSDVDADVEGTKGRRALTIGRGGPTLTFRSTSGDLRVVRAVEHRPATEPAAPEPSRPPLEPRPPVPPSSPLAPPLPTLPPDPRLDVLRALEVGTIDVAEAERRLAAIDHEEGPHA